LTDGPSIRRQSRAWMVFVPVSPKEGEVLGSLTEALKPSVIVRPGMQFRKTHERSYEIHPADPRHYEELLQSVWSDGIELTDIVHLWSLGETKPVADAMERFRLAQEMGYDSVLLLTQALSKGAEKPIRFSIVSSGIHGITGTETLRPEN